MLQAKDAITACMFIAELVLSLAGLGIQSSRQLQYKLLQLQSPWQACAAFAEVQVCSFASLKPTWSMSVTPRCSVGRSFNMECHAPATAGGIVEGLYQNGIWLRKSLPPS